MVGEGGTQFVPSRTSLRGRVRVFVRCAFARFVIADTGVGEGRRREDLRFFRKNSASVMDIDITWRSRQCMVRRALI